MPDLADLLGSDEAGSAETLTLYIPSCDRDGTPFDTAPWVEEALRLLSTIGGGATAMPPADGAWLNPASGQLVREPVVLVYTFVRPEAFEAKVGEVREFLHRLGRNTGQGEVVCDFGGVLYRIWTYDSGKG